MTITDAIDGRAIGRLVLGLVLGLSLVPLTIFLLLPEIEGVTGKDFIEAPRDLKAHWTTQLAQRDRHDQHVLVGTSLMRRGFATGQPGLPLRLWLPGMNFDETSAIVEGLVNRPRPPKTVIIDWAALHNAPLVGRGPRQPPRYLSMDNLFFAINYNMHRNAQSATQTVFWETTPRVAAKNRDFRAFLIAARKYEATSRYVAFLEFLEPLCRVADTRFAIVRFPVDLEGRVEEFGRYLDETDPQFYVRALDQSTCDVGFVDFMSEGLAIMRAPEPSPMQSLLKSRESWSDSHHFTPQLGAAFLADPRLLGARDQGARAGGDQPRLQD